MLTVWYWRAPARSGPPGNRIEKRSAPRQYGEAMAEGFDIAAMIQRFKDRAQAVRNRPLPPVAGEERTQFVRQRQIDFQDFAMVGDATGNDRGRLPRVAGRPAPAGGQGRGWLTSGTSAPSPPSTPPTPTTPTRSWSRGVTRPKEQAHAELMTEWVSRLDPDASDEQLLAARAHHLRRWTIPRSSYPDGRTGYLRWRTALKNQHGDDIARILGEVGYGRDVDRARRADRPQGEPAGRRRGADARGRPVPRVPRDPADRPRRTSWATTRRSTSCARPRRR